MPHRSNTATLTTSELRLRLLQLIDRCVHDDQPATECGCLHAVEAYVSVGDCFGVWDHDDLAMIMATLQAAFDDDR